MRFNNCIEKSQYYLYFLMVIVALINTHNKNIYHVVRLLKIGIILWNKTLIFLKLEYYSLYATIDTFKLKL